MSAHAPRWRHSHKALIYDIAMRGTESNGVIEYSRWPTFELPGRFEPSANTRIEARRGYFDYASSGAFKAVVWHVNFADADLFFGYESALFAQDEVQVAEHPALGAIRATLKAQGRLPVAEEDSRSTPVLISGVERRCQIDSSQIYGRAFVRAKEATIRAAIKPLSPPTRSRIIAMAAPSHGRGSYSADEIGRVLVTAYTGFRAAVIESHRLEGMDAFIEIHSGFWGCGAFGGNRELMLTLQILAARLAGVSRLCLWYGPDASCVHVEGASELVQELDREVGEDVSTQAVIAKLVAHGFEWGVGNGT